MLSSDQFNTNVMKNYLNMSSKKVATLITFDLNVPLHFSCLGSGMTTNDLLFICTTSFMKINYEPTT